MGFVIADPQKYWKGNKIPYRIDQTDFPVGSIGWNAISAAISEWNDTCALHLEEHTESDKDWVTFKLHQDMCQTVVGRQGGEQFVHCALPPFDKTGIMHEIGHAVGFFHEHQRPNRDDYVIVDPSLLNNVNYQIKEKEGVMLGDYDCTSIMHYFENPPNILRRPETGCTTIGGFSPSCIDVIAAGAIGVAPTTPIVLGTPYGRTRDSDPYNPVTYQGLRGNVQIHKGRSVIVEVDPNLKEVVWYGDPGTKTPSNPKPDTTDYPMGTKYLVIFRHANKDYWDVIFYK